MYNKPDTLCYRDYVLRLKMKKMKKKERQTEKKTEKKTIRVGVVGGGLVEMSSFQTRWSHLLEILFHGHAVATKMIIMSLL